MQLHDICALHRISVYHEHQKDLQGRPSIVIALKCLGTCKLVSTLSGTISLVPSLLLEANFKQRAVTIDENVSQLLATPRKFWELMLHAEPLCIVARHPETFKIGQYLHTRSSKDSLESLLFHAESLKVRRAATTECYFEG